MLKYTQIGKLSIFKISEQNLKKKTLILITLLDMQYWSDENRKRISNKIIIQIRSNNMDLNDRSYEGIIEKLNRGLINFLDIDAINEIVNGLARDSKAREQFINVIKAYVKKIDVNVPLSNIDVTDYNFEKWRGLMLIINDKDFIEECIEDYSDEAQSIARRSFASRITYEQSNLSEKSRNESRVHSYFTMDSDVALRYHDEELRYISEDNLIVRIEDAIDAITISNEDLERLKANCRIQNETWFERDKYTIDEIRNISNKLKNDILKGIEKPKSNDFESQFEVFSEICKRLAAHIEYDDDEIEYCKKMGIGCRDHDTYTVRNAILKGRSVCSGNSKTLKLALKMHDIECEYISGNPEIKDKENIPLEDQHGHAWNQVKIGGHWFNFDLTWARDRIVNENGLVTVELLKTDSEFSDHDKYGKNRPSYEHKCETSVFDLVDDEFILRHSGSILDKINYLHTRDDETKKKWIDILISDNNEQNKTKASLELDERLIAGLIISLDNQDYLKNCIESEKLKYRTHDLLIATQDKEYMKEWVKGQLESKTKDLSGTLAVAIETMDGDIIKKVIMQGSNTLTEYDMYSAAIKTKDPAFVAECFQNDMFPDFVDQDTLEEDIRNGEDDKFLVAWQEYIAGKTLVKHVNEKSEDVAEIEDDSQEGINLPQEDKEVVTTEETKQDITSNNKRLLGRMVDKYINLFKITKSELKETWLRL